MSQPSLAGFMMKRPWLMRWMKPLSNWYADAAGYRKLGLRYGQPPGSKRRIREDTNAVVETFDMNYMD